MAISGLKTWATDDALTAANLNTDKAVLEAKFDQNITAADLSASAGITNAQLANSHYEIVLDLAVDGATWAASDAGDYVAFAGLPADVDAEDYDVVQVDFVEYAAGGLAFGGDSQTFDVVFGYFGAADSAFTVSDTIVSGQAFVSITADQGAAGTCSLNDSSITTSTTNKQFFAIAIGTLGADFAAVGEHLVVSIKLKRNSGLRS